MLLGIDVGTTHTKVVAYSKQGKVLARAKSPTPKGRHSDGLVNYLPDEIWKRCAGLIRKVVKSTDSIEAVAVASMGESGVPLNQDLEPVYPIIPWYDGERSKAELQDLTGILPKSRWYDITGLYPSAIHSVFKWRWLEKHHPAAWQRTQLWLSMSDYIGFKLTGNAVMEAGQAARTMAYDVRQGSWSNEILALLGKPQFLPKISSAASQLGAVTADVAKLTGLVEGTPVFVGGHDHFCAAFACGALTADIVMDSFGTAEAMTIGYPGQPDPSQANALAVGPHVVPGHSYLLGGIYSSGGAVAWLKTLLQLDYAQLPRLASRVAPGNAPLFIAEFHGAAPPFNVPNAAGAFLELNPEHKAGHLIRAVYEGVAFELKLNLLAFEATTQQHIACVRMVGGSGSLPLWSKIRAAIYEKPIEIAAHDDMVTLGTALLAGLGAGIYSSPEQAIASSYRRRTTIQPDARWQEVYQASFARYQSYVTALRTVQEGS